MPEPPAAIRPPFDAGLERLLCAHGFDLSSEQVASISAYVALLGTWNERVNLVSSTELHILGPLILEALWAASRYPADFRSHLDIGSGGGFPALPLGIVQPGVEVTLVESRTRKAVFLETVVCELGLRNLRIVNQRLDQYLRSLATPGPWQCVSVKGLRLTRKEIQRLLRSAAGSLCIWIFHGRDLPFEFSPKSYGLELLSREECPFHPDWYLSQFQKGAVSRETQ